MTSIFPKVAMILLCLIGVVAQDVMAEKCGPNIKGLQLGMNEEEADRVMKELGLMCKASADFKTSQNISECLRNDAGMLNFYTKPEGSILPAVNIRFKDGIVNYISIDDGGIEDIFNAVGTRKGFLQAFVNKYHLNMKGYGHGKTPQYYEQKDIEKGYLVRCVCDNNKEVKEIILQTIPKETGNFSF